MQIAAETEKENSPFDCWKKIETNEQGQGECESDGVDVEERIFARGSCAIRHLQSPRLGLSVRNLERRAGIEPANTGFADPRVCHFATGAL
jgi:hypothetical protein